MKWFLVGVVVPLVAGPALTWARTRRVRRNRDRRWLGVSVTVLVTLAWVVAMVMIARAV